MAKQNQKLAVEKALEFAKTCSAKQLSVDEFLKLIEQLNNFFNNGKQSNPPGTFGQGR